ncbi:MAG TPA: aspartate--tRNA ligase [Acidobacteriota bacterium]|nr:aspartate--tRNA ligase [Acidobacteriota bacterium]
MTIPTTLTTAYRTHTCGALRASDKGKHVKLSGWVATRRDHGGIIFIDLRDRYGITQIVFDPVKSKDCFENASKLRREDTIVVGGIVSLRGDSLTNKRIDTGEIEVFIDTLTVLAKAEVPPIDIDDEKAANDDLRLEYRYIDLRRPSMQKKLRLRHDVVAAAREFAYANGFVEIDTPLLIKSTPEGARDYVVPSRVNPGTFYALPQSPQIYKQILMIAGCDRYFQVAKCLRDEDLRADRQPEHTQFDLEMSFVSQDDVHNFVSGMYANVMKKVLNVDVKLPLPKFTYAEALDKYGIDKPDIRFDLFTKDVTSIVVKSDFGVFKTVAQNGGIIKCLNPQKDLARNEIDGYIDFCQKAGAKGMAWMRVSENGLESNIAKYFAPEVQKELIAATGAKPGSILMFIADKPKQCNDVISKLRLKLGEDLGLIDKSKFAFCWIVDFPMFEFDEEEKKWNFMHNPFSAPNENDLEFLETDMARVRAQQYDLVLNGYEMGSGSIRITNPQMQQRVFKLIGYDEEAQQRKFGFLLKAYKYGAPVHGGMGLGVDRLCALMLGTGDIREVIAFPKNKNAQCPMDASPSPIDDKQLKELHIKLELPKKEEKKL